MPRLKLPAALLLGLALAAAPAYAKKDKGDTDYITIEETGIQEIDQIFSSVKAIQDTLIAVDTSITTTTTSLNTTLGLAADTPFTTALEDLKSRAEGALQVTLDGGSPQLSASDAVPANVQEAIDAVNLGVSEVNSAIGDLKTLPNQLRSLQKQAASFDPGKVKEQASQAGMGLTETLEAVKIVAQDLKATSQTVDRAVEVKDASLDFMSAFTGTFGEATGGGGRGGSASGGASGGEAAGGSRGGASGGKGSDKDEGSRGRSRGSTTGPGR